MNPDMNSGVAQPAPTPMPQTPVSNVSSFAPAQPMGAPVVEEKKKTSGLVIAFLVLVGLLIVTAVVLFFAYPAFYQMIGL